MEKGTGKRFNEGKTRYDLISPFANKILSDVLTSGAEKYGSHNWQKGMSWSKVIASLKRHLAAIENGQDFDNESGILHVGHLMCNAMFLAEYYKIYPEGDDRELSYLRIPKIGLDIDDVICDFVSGFRKKYNLAEPKSWFWSYNTQDYLSDLVKNQKELEDFYSNLKPKINPDEIPFEPHCYITSRTVPIEITQMWIEKNGFPCKKIYSIPFNESKVEVAKESGIEIFVDDRFDNFVELNNAGIFCYLFDTPWNSRYEVGHRRIRNLKEIINGTGRQIR